MNKINTGGPAFPLVYDEPPENVRNVYQGMTLRDYFAAHASEEDIKHAMRFVQPVEAILSGPNGHKEVIQQHPTNARQVARYIVADQMLEARK